MRQSLLSFTVFFLVTVTAGFGQATANFTASVTIIQPVGITTTSNMNFANLDAKSGGEVILTPGNDRIVSGGVEIAEGGIVSAATFEVTGQQGFTYSVSLPETQYELTNGSERILIKDFTAVNGNGILSEGSQIISVGATLEVQPDQQPGFYTSSNPMAVTVNYN